eukprot:TRINITY_DN18317_c0_g1_i2.p1 TRINITY_DN18317_c0_g1~~TRINITY_DN18317_c0_g1_i2.p1  ORF type:complete len:126 (+),score=15.95 TRINITY_DN18317_c0_g1_i2:105-482(+)
MNRQKKQQQQPRRQNDHSAEFALCERLQRLIRDAPLYPHLQQLNVSCMSMSLQLDSNTVKLEILFHESQPENLEAARNLLYSPDYGLPQELLPYLVLGLVSSSSSSSSSNSGPSSSSSSSSSSSF